MRRFLFFLVALLFASVSFAQVAPGLIDPNVAKKDQVAALPGMTAAIAKDLTAKRPFANAIAFDEFLGGHKLDDDARKALYAKAFIHINLNTASATEMKLIPGVGKRMAHEFDEYRPWKSFKQFDKEIGKYVKKDELARLKTYCFIPLDLNKATREQFMTIPGVGKRMAHEFDEYRPWKSKKQFQKEIGKYVKPKEVARLWRYMKPLKSVD